MFIDLDRFKLINDTLGHGAGDTLLIEIAPASSIACGTSDMVSRSAAMSSSFCCRNGSDARQVTSVGAKILAAVVKPMTVHGQECRVTASIGISLFPSDAQDEETLTKNADAAMYAVKEEGRNSFLFHSREIKTQSIERLMLETSLRRALERDELVSTISQSAICAAAAFQASRPCCAGTIPILACCCPVASFSWPRKRA